MEGIDIHKFLGRCADHRRGDHQTGKHCQHHTGKDKYLLVGLGGLNLALLGLEEVHHLQHQQGNAQSADGKGDLQYLLGILQLIEDCLEQAEQVI